MRGYDVMSKDKMKEIVIDKHPTMLTVLFNLIKRTIQWKRYMKGEDN